MNTLVGIDLGTTYSGISILNEMGKPEIIPNDEGERLTSSLVYFPENEPRKSFVGVHAQNALAYNPERVIREVKRKMGEPEIYEMDDQKYSPEEISAFILKKLIQSAALTKGDIKKAVITVPANFSESARKATIEAGTIAGIEVSNIINEPTAAALFYATQNPLSGRVVIYDLGGGTFDVTVAEIKDKDVECLVSLGDKYLGGVDFDQKLLEVFNNRYIEEYGVKLFEGDYDSYKYLKIADTMKKTLSARPKAQDVLNGPAGPLPVEISREQFEELISIFVARTELLIDAALKEISIKPSDISQVLLIGGSSRIPKVSDSLKKIFGREPLRAVNLDESVALGAAVYAGLKVERKELNAAQAKEISSIKLADVCNHYFGTIIASYSPEFHKIEETNSIMLDKNTMLPCSKTETFQTIYEGQTEIECVVTQSLSAETDPKFVTNIWEGSLDNLPPGRPADRPIEVTFTYDENQMMHVSYKDVETGKVIEKDLHPKLKEGSSDVGDFLVE